MKRTAIKRIMAALLSGMMLVQNAPFSAFAEGLAADDNNKPDAVKADTKEKTEDNTEERSDEKNEPTAPSEEPDLSSMRLLVCADDEAALFCSVPTTILSEYDGVYLLSFESEEDTKEAYYYYSSVCTSVEPDIPLFVADDDYLQDKSVAAADPLSRLSLLLDENSDEQKYDIALIDTGIAEGGVSVISENASDDNGHGEKMRGIINDVSPSLSVLSVKAFDSRGVGSVSSVYAAICYAVEKNAAVIDLPFAAKSAADSPLLERAVSMANDKGIIVIGAAGNDHADAAAYIPAKVQGVIIAGACDDAGIAIPSSNYGEAVFCNVLAKSTSEAATRLSAMAAEYGMEQLQAEMGNGILFPCGETVGNSAQQDGGLPSEEQDNEADEILPADVSDEEISYLDFDRNNPPDQQPTIGNGITIDHVYLRWLSKGEEGSQPFGNLELAPDTVDSPNQQFQIDFDLSGQYPHEPGSVQITIPAYLWTDRNGKECGTLTLSVPEDPETGAEFSWKRVGDQIVITNVRTLPAATKIMIQGTFRNVDASEIEDLTKADFQATVTVTGQNDSISMESNDISATMDTHIEASGADKTAFDGTTGRYTVWWGELPPDMPGYFWDEGRNAEDYLFVRWYVSGEAKGNQPFDMTVYDEIGDAGSAYGGIMLGVSHCAGGNVKSADSKSVTAKLYEGFSTLPQTAYVWTAYERDKLPKDNDLTKISNKQTINVVGKDDRKRAEEAGIDPVPSEAYDTADIEIKEPTTYKFTKKWIDDDNEEGHRPEYLDIKITSKTLGKTTTVRLFPKGEGSEWTYTWNDNGQSQEFSVQELLDNASGIEMEYFDSDLHQYKWGYQLSRDKELGYKNGEDNEWVFPNVYYEKWVSPGGQGVSGINTIKKNSLTAFSDGGYISKRDSLSLNSLMLGNDVYVPYKIETSVSAAQQYLDDRNKKTLFTLEDKEYILNDNNKLTLDDMDIGAVTFTAPRVYRYAQNSVSNDKIPADSEWYEKERIVPPATTLYGLIDDSWVPLAEWTPDEQQPPEDDKAEDAGSLTAKYGGVKIIGSRIELPKGVAGIRVQLNAAAAFAEIVCQPEVRIHSTASVRAMIEECYEGGVEYSMLSLKNKATSYSEDAESTDTRYSEQFDYSDAYLHGKKYKIAADLNKKYTLTKNDTAKKQLVLHSAIEFTQQSNVLSLEDFRAVAASGEIPYSKGGTYYDLLPRGVEPDLNTITLTNGDRMISADIKQNYKNSDRTLLIVRVEFAEHLIGTYSSKYPDDNNYPTEGFRSSHVLEFDSYLLHNTFRNENYRENPIHNIAAFEAQETNIASIEGWQGEKDDPTGAPWSETGGNNANAHKRTQDAGSMEELNWLKDLDSVRNDPSFVYAGDVAVHNEIDVSARSSLEKYVKSPGFGSWSTGVGKDDPVTVHEGGRYVYRLQVSSALADTSEILVIDSLENYFPHSGEGLEPIDEAPKRWYGYLESIDDSAARAKDIDVVTYYYTGEGRPMGRDYSAQNTPTEEVLKKLQASDSGWTKAKPDDMKTVKAVAFDLRKKTNGDDFVLEDTESIPIRLYMRAPDKISDPDGKYLDEKDPTDPNKNGHAYNEVYMNCAYMDNAGGTQYTYLYRDYTKVGINTNNIKVIKAWDDADDADGIRADSVTVHLLANGKRIQPAAELNEGIDWTYTFERLDTCDENGNLITYTVEEDPVPDSYTLQTALTYEDGNMVFTLNNVHEPEKTVVPVTKEWVFGDDGSGFDKLPASVTFRLWADGEETGKTLIVKPDASGNWYGGFTDLIKNKKGKPINYTVTEDPITDFVLMDPPVPDGRGGFKFTNKYYPYGDILLIKTVTDGTEASKDYNLKENDEHPFRFTLQLYTEDNDGNRTVVTNKYPYYIYDSAASEYETLEDFRAAIEDDEEGLIPSDGKVGNGDRLSLLEGQQIIIKDIPSNVRYTLTEDSRKEYELDNDKTVGDKGLIRSGSAAKAEFVNRYITKGTALIEAQKVLTGRVLNGYQFRFELRDQNGTLIRSANNYASGRVTFNVEYSNADNGKEYTYYMTEVNSGQSGYQYSTLKYMIKVTPVDNGDGTMECNVEYFNEDGSPINVKIGGKIYNEPVFENIYKASGKVKFVAWKDLDGRSLSADEFTFKLYDEQGELKDTKTNNENGVIAFDELTFNETDAGKTYRYFAREIKPAEGADKTVVYDTHVICYVVEVIDNGDGTLDFNQSTYVLENESGLDCGDCGGTGKVTSEDEEVTCTACNGLGFIAGKDSDTPVFKNSLKPGLLSVTKKVTETSENTDDQKFTFNIRLIGDKIKEGMKFTGKDSNGDTVETYTVNKDGDYTFKVKVGIDQTITFDNIPAGTAYQVWEDDEAGWYLSKREGASGLIEATKTATAVLTNKYDVNMTRAIIVGTKLLDNKPAHEFNGKPFQFEIVELVNGNPTPVKGSPVSAVEGGFIQFEIEYREVSEHTYIIREVVDESNKDIVYDRHDEKVVVKVEKDSKGFLKATVEYVNTKEDTDNAVRFENYTAPGALQISKVGEGLNDVNDKEFTFEVSFFNENGIPLSDEALEWYLVDRDGNGKTSEQEMPYIGRDISRDIVSQSSLREVPADPAETAANHTLRSLTAEIVCMTIAASDGARIAVDEPAAVADNSYTPPSLDDLSNETPLQNGTLGTENSGVKWSIFEIDNDVVLLLEPGDTGDTTEFTGLGNIPDKGTITAVMTKGDLSIGNTKTLQDMFTNFSKLKYADLSGLDLSYQNGDDGDISYLFRNCTNLNTVIFNDKPITGRSSVIGLFLSCTNLQTVENLKIEYSGTKIVNGNEIFRGCKSLTLVDLSSWDISSKMSALQMFYECTNITDVTFGEKWKNTQLTTMKEMFRECSNLTKIDAQNLNTSQVTDMQLLFLSCTKLQFGMNDLQGWKTGNVQNFQETFGKCKALESLDLSAWDTSSATNMRQMFYESNFTTLKLDNWNVGNVTTMYQMFMNCSSLLELDLSSWKWGEEGKLTNLQQTFVSCVNMTKLDVRGWNTSAVTTLESTFDNCQKLTDIVGVENWNTSSVTNMSQTFYKCLELKKNDPNHMLDLSKWETGRVTTMRKMFSMESTSSNLEKIIVPWDTSKVTDMYQMFNFCTKLKELDLSTWDTSNVTNMERMFAVCWELADENGTITGIENFKTDKVTNMLQMFMECKKVTNLDLSGWNTDRVTTIAQMFKSCESLEKLDISKFNTKKATDVNMSNVFSGSEKIKEITFGASFYASANYEGGTLCDVPTNAPYNGKWVQKDELNLLERDNYTSEELRDMLRANPSLQATTYVWDTLNYYTVEFEPGTDDFAGEMTKGRCDPDEDFILPDNKFTRYGYVFTGWWDEVNDTKYIPDAYGKVTIPAKTYKNKAEITLTAQWVKYDTAKGLPYYVDVYKEKPDDDETKTADSKYYLDYTLIFYIEDPTTPTTVTMPDDTIDEPFYVAPETKEYEISSASGIVHIPLYYDLKRFTIHFDPNPAEGDTITGSQMADIQMVGDAACVLGNTYINGSKRFVGWNTQKDGNGFSFGAGNSYTTNDFDFTQGGEITLYAIWQDNSEKIEPTAGKITVKCRAGDMIVFPKLPAGTTYTVKEINIPSGWTLKEFRSDGSTTANGEFGGTIISNQYVSVQAVNVYSANGGGILQAHKRYDGDTLQQGAFSFDLYTLSDAQVSYTENYHEDGSFVGVVNPHDSFENNVTVDGAEKLFVVLHYNTEDETETESGASVEVESGTGNEPLTFKGNGTEYLSISGNTVTFKANCSGGIADYHATVYKVNTIDPAVKNGSPDQLDKIPDKNGDLVTNDWYNTGLVTFKMQSYTEPGEYTYYIRERIGDDPKIEYDEHIVKAVVTVTDSGDGSFATQVDYYDLDENMNAKKASGALFVNKKKTGQLSIEKKLIDASGTIKDMPFEFTIHINDASNNPLNGTFELIEGDYTEPSEEDPPEVKTITFENGTAVLSIKGGERITILGLPDGAKYSVEEKKLTYFEQTDASGLTGSIESGTTSEVSVTNTYRISDDIRITAMKELIGGDLGSYKFEFELLDYTHKPVETAECDSDGVITFKTLEFTEADIGRDIYYYIREVKGTESNIRYDEDEKTVKIHVGKDSSNKIQLEVSVLDPETREFDPYTDMEQLKFTNLQLYDLTVSKSVTGEYADRTKSFGFTLTLENTEYQLPSMISCKTGSTAFEMQLDSSGSLTFDLRHGEAITFSGLPPKTRYTITEGTDRDYNPVITVSDPAADIGESTVRGTLNADTAAAYQNVCNIVGPLPVTGGAGTARLYVCGGVLTALGALYFIRRRRAAGEAE